MINPDLEERIYDEYKKIIPIHVTDAIAYLNEHAVMYAEKVPKKGIDTDRYCFGHVCLDTIAHRNEFYKKYPDIANILDTIEKEEPFTYRMVNFDLLTCCTSVTFEKEGIMIWRYIQNVSKTVSGFFDTSLQEWAVSTAMDVWDEICPAECEKIGGTVEAIICPDETERGFVDGINIISYAEADHKKNILDRYISSRATIRPGERTYTGSTLQDRWDRT